MKKPRPRPTFDPEKLPSTFTDQYQMLRKLGTGGAGDVHLALDLSKKQKVAIKFCPTGEGKGRFEHEVSILRSLDHQNVARILDSGLVDGVPYLVMAYHEGRTLRSIIKRKPQLPVNEAISYISQVLQALGCIHERGIIHRDLKPENILIDRDKRAIILDLGIAASWSDGSAGQPTANIAGTPTYMSPEQCRGDPTGIPSDLYSIGVIVFEILAGCPPFAGATLMETMRAHSDAKIPRITGFRADLGSGWDVLMAKVLAKAPADRFQEAQVFVQALDKTAKGTYSKANLPAIHDLESHSSILPTGGGPVEIAGLAVVGSLLCGSVCALATAQPFVALACLLPLFSIFMAEEPGRFRQLGASLFFRGLTYVTGLAMIVPLIAAVESLGQTPPYPYAGTFFVVLLAWFGGYHTRDPEGRMGILVHRAAHIVLLLIICSVFLTFGVQLAAGLGGIAALLATIALRKPPAKTRHLSLGQATTTILLQGAIEPTLESSHTVVGVKAPKPGRIIIRSSKPKEETDGSFSKSKE